MNLRQIKSLETKKRISKVAMELFNIKGFTNVTVDEIVEKTSTSKGSFYNHFKSKHDIFSEKFKEIDEFYVEVLAPQLKSFDSTKLKLKFFLSMQMKFIENDLGWDVVRTIYEQELNTERVSFFLNPNRPLYNILYKLCDEGIENGEFRDDHSTNQLVLILVRVMRGILYDWSINKGNFKLQEEHDSLFSIVIDGLAK